MTLKKMDKFSERASKEILDAFPEWQNLADTQEGVAGKIFFVLKIGPPADADVDQGLLIHTHNNEITVAFDYYHSHFDSVLGDGEPDGIGAVEFVRGIIEERIAVASWWLDDKWMGSVQIEAGTPPTFPFKGKYNRLRVRSWNGRYNTDTRV